MTGEEGGQGGKRRAAKLRAETAPPPPLKLLTERQHLRDKGPTMTAVSEDTGRRGQPGNRLFTQENSQRVPGGEGGWGLGNPAMGRKTGVCPDEHQLRGQ